LPSKHSHKSHYIQNASRHQETIFNVTSPSFFFSGYKIEKRIIMHAEFIHKPIPTSNHPFFQFLCKINNIIPKTLAPPAVISIRLTKPPITVIPIRMSEKTNRCTADGLLSLTPDKTAVPKLSIVLDEIMSHMAFSL